jgi:hypothetical protein
MSLYSTTAQPAGSLPIPVDRHIADRSPAGLLVLSLQKCAVFFDSDLNIDLDILLQCRYGTLVLART